MDLMELQTAYATQLTTEQDGKGEWIVYNNKKQEIYRFPANWNEKQVMAAIHFGRRFELIAFNKGVEFQKSKNPQTIVSLQRMVKNYESDRKQMIERNTLLADELDKLNIKFETLIKN